MVLSKNKVSLGDILWNTTFWMQDLPVALEAHEQNPWLGAVSTPLGPQPPPAPSQLCRPPPPLPPASRHSQVLWQRIRREVLAGDGHLLRLVLQRQGAEAAATCALTGQARPLPPQSAAACRQIHYHLSQYKFRWNHTDRLSDNFLECFIININRKVP